MRGHRLPINGLILAAGVCLAAGFFAACASRAARIQHASAGGAVSYDEVHAVFRESCEHCHNEDKAKGGLLMDSYEALLAGGENGNPIVAGQSASSRLVQMLEGTITPRMPYKEDPLPASQVDLIRRWIDAGAPGPGSDRGQTGVRPGSDRGQTGVRPLGRPRSRFPT